MALSQSKKAVAARKRRAAMSAAQQSVKVSLRSHPLEIHGDELYWNKQRCAVLLPAVSAGLSHTEKADLQEYINGLHTLAVCGDCGGPLEQCAGCDNG